MRYFLFLCAFLGGCNGINRLTGMDIKSRNDNYDSSPVYPSVPIAEPYATFVGRHYWSDGTFTRLFLIHWKGNSLDNTSVLETDLIDLGIREE